ncbi:unnamed protein product, partial [Nesidiocoris tenuis]
TPGESKIPVLGKGSGTSSPKPLSRLASFSSKVRAHLSPDATKLRPASGTLLSFLSNNSRGKNLKRGTPQRPSGFYQPLVSDWNPALKCKSGGPSPESLEISSHSIGKRVSVSGCKEGILKFFGKTELGDDLWCGVELDAPEGLNDGSVNGIRYFTCKPNHGVIAPKSKVSLVQPTGYDQRKSRSIQDGVNNPDIDAVVAATALNPRSESETSTPGSSSLPLFDFTLSSRHSSAGHLMSNVWVLRTTYFVDGGPDIGTRSTQIRNHKFYYMPLKFDKFVNIFDTELSRSPGSKIFMVALRESQTRGEMLRGLQTRTTHRLGFSSPLRFNTVNYASGM